MSKRKGPAPRIGVFKNIGRYSGPFNPFWYAREALRHLATVHWRMLQAVAPQVRVTGVTAADFAARKGYGPPTFAKVQSTPGVDLTFHRSAFSFVWPKYPVVLEPKMDQNWCYRCKCPKSVCGVWRSPVPTVLFVGGPLDGKRQAGPAEELFIVPMANYDYPSWIGYKAQESMPILKTGTYKRMSLVMPGKQTTLHHVVYVWAGEDTPRPVQVGDNLVFQNEAVWRVATSSGGVVTARRVTNVLQSLDVPAAALVFDDSAFQANSPSGAWRVKVGTVVNVLERRTA